MNRRPGTHRAFDNDHRKTNDHHRKEDTMKNATTTLLIFMAALVLVPASGAEIGASAGVDFVSRYVWRGFNLSDGPNTQPGAEISAGGLTLGYWGSFNWDAEDTNLEQDLYAGYDFSLADERVGVSLGYTYYKFPSAGEAESHEFWLGLSLDTLLAPSITLYFDVGDAEDGGGDGEYFVVSISHDFEIERGVTLGLAAGLGYNNELFIDENGLADFTPSASLSFEVNENLSLGLSANYSAVIDSDVEAAMGADDEFWATLSVSVS
jgi:uncharacterized protein (TIGR02001 family)